MNWNSWLIESKVPNESVGNQKRHKSQKLVHWLDTVRRRMANNQKTIDTRTTIDSSSVQVRTDFRLHQNECNSS